MKKHMLKCEYVLAENCYQIEKEKLVQELNCQHELEMKELNCQHELEIQELQKTLTQQQIHHAQEIQELQKIIATLQGQNTLLHSELEKSQTMLRTVTEQAINRPTSLTQNIDNKNIKITNYLSDHSAYRAQTQPERVRHMLDMHLEDYFFDGQVGLAKFVVDHVIRLEDGKMILCCTDTSRKRFRFVDANEKIEEDMKAKMLCSKLSVPVREMCNSVYDRIVQKLTNEKNLKISNGVGGFAIDFLEKKIDLAHNRYMEIREFDAEENSNFVNELASLLRNPEEVSE